MKNWILLLLLNLSSTLLLIHAQCPDFTNLSSPNVICQYGDTHNPMRYTGIAFRRHTVITHQGSDPYTGHQLPFLPPGENAVVKLGNEFIGAEAEAITYRFTVDPDQAILLLKFAVVFEDPGHPAPDQPRFVVRVLNDEEQLVEECAEYDVTAASNIPGFQTYISGWSSIRYRPWTNVGIDLSDYAGQPIRVQFITYDCNWYGHFGYAYFTASCINNRLSLNGCNGNQVTLVAPSDFESYTWDNGSNSTSATYTINGTTTANCLITSATGCQFMLSGTITAEPDIPSTSSIINDTICEGDSYNQNYFNLPVQNDTGTHIFRNTFFNSNNCSDGNVTTTLSLTVSPHINHVYDMICQGMDYNNHGFHYTNLQTGIYTDTLVTELNTGCNLMTILHLTVNPSFSMNNSILGENTVCDNEVFQYTLPNADDLATFQWNVPDGVNILTGQNTAEVNLYFTNNAPNPAEITLTGINGCGNGSISLSVTHSPSYYYFYQDSICTGNDYHRYGFNLARQDSIGLFSFINNYTTAQGCDSVHILQLLVTSTPSITTLAQPSEICAGQGSIVHAMGENAGFPQGEMPAINIGDILCTDNSIVKSSAWPVEGKTAMGIVFYIDNTDEHGWAVHLQDQGTNLQWGGYGVDIPALPNFINGRNAMMDMDGYNRTQIIRLAGDANTYPAAFAVDFSNDWYLPTVGQLRLLYAEIVTINASLQIVGGTLFPMNSYFLYWSSTERDAEQTWFVNMHGEVTYTFKNVHDDNMTRVRSVRSF